MLKSHREYRSTYDGNFTKNIKTVVINATETTKQRDRSFHRNSSRKHITISTIIRSEFR